MPAPLTLADFTRAATTLGCEPAAVQALAEVESAGAGFLPDGRPTLLFEAHHFHRLTGGKFDAEKDRNGIALSVPHWDRTLYGAGGVHQWIRRNDAANLDFKAADMSCSWGAFQIMGENFHMAGFRDVASFVAAMQAGSGAQLDAFVAFIRSAGLAGPLARREWAAVARGYNGPGAVDEYAGKLLAAYGRLSDTGIPVSEQNQPVKSAEIPADRMSEADRLNAAEMARHAAG